MKKAALHNLGCKVNSYETQSMEQMLKNAGYEIVDFEKEMADVYIINTCSVTNMADRKSRQMLHRAKKMNPEAIVIAAGCYVQASAKEAIEDDAVDIIVGNNKKVDIVSIIDEFIADNTNKSKVIDISSTDEYEELNIDRVSDHTRAYIKVQDGCNQFCTYCIIPYTRGRIRSRKLNEILDEISILAKNGYKEVVLTGIHLSSYGLDFNGDRTSTDFVNDSKLIDLVEAVNNIDGIERIRLGSLEPRIVTESFAQRLGSLSKVCAHFHLSLQSGSNTTLKRMNRKYNTDEYEKGCALLRKYFENPAITTDVIVGFPQESEEEFEETYNFLSKINFYEMHIFKYSRRKGTVADKMPGQIKDGIKDIRSNRLLELSNKMSDDYRSKIIGKSVDVLFEEEIIINGKPYFVGHTKTYVKVAVESDKNISNCILAVNVEEKMGKDLLFGEIENI